MHELEQFVLPPAIDRRAEIACEIDCGSLAEAIYDERGIAGQSGDSVIPAGKRLRELQQRPGSCRPDAQVKNRGRQECSMQARQDRAWRDFLHVVPPLGSDDRTGGGDAEQIRQGELPALDPILVVARRLKGREHGTA